jgi:serine/threonine protein kinase
MGKKRILNDKKNLIHNNRRKYKHKDERTTKCSCYNDSPHLSNLEGMKKFIKQNNQELDDIFEFQEYIGSGAESYVYKTILKKNGKVVANKMIVIKERERKRIFNEIMISKKMKHQNIVGFYGCYEVKKNEVSCIVMEYSKYGNLRDFGKKWIEKKILYRNIYLFHIFPNINCSKIFRIVQNCSS